MRLSRRVCALVTVIAVGLTTIVYQVPSLAEESSSEEQTTLAQDVTTESPADGEAVRVESVAPFDPSGGRAIFEPGTQWEEAFSYGGVDVEDKFLTDVRRTNPYAHPSGSIVARDNTEAEASPTPTDESEDIGQDEDAEPEPGSTASDEDSATTEPSPTGSPSPTSPESTSGPEIASGASPAEDGSMDSVGTETTQSSLRCENVDLPECAYELSTAPGYTLCNLNLAPCPSYAIFVMFDDSFRVESTGTLCIGFNAFETFARYVGDGWPWQASVTGANSASGSGTLGGGDGRGVFCYNASNTGLDTIDISVTGCCGSVARGIATREIVGGAQIPPCVNDSLLNGSLLPVDGAVADECLMDSGLDMNIYVTATPTLQAILYPGENCRVDAFKAERDGQAITGLGATGCPNNHDVTSVEVCLWKKRWYGWQRLDPCSVNHEVDNNSAATRARVPCADGTWTYRTVANGWIIENERVWPVGEDISDTPHLRTKC